MERKFKIIINGEPRGTINAGSRTAEEVHHTMMHPMDESERRILISARVIEQRVKRQKEPRSYAS